MLLSLRNVMAAIFEDLGMAVNLDGFPYFDAKLTRQDTQMIAGSSR